MSTSEPPPKPAAAKPSDTTPLLVLGIGVVGLLAFLGWVFTR